MSSVCLDSLSYAGWLKKKGHTHGLWHKRFVSLDGNILQISKDDTKTSVETTITITTETEVIADQSNFNRFVIKNVDEEGDYMFTAASSEEATRWVTALSAASLPSPKLSMDDFKIISVIGRGFYGKVMLVRKNDTGELYAIKTIHKSYLIESGKTNAVIAERNLMMKAKYPFLVSLYFTFQNESKFYLGLEYVPGGDLYFYKQRVGTLPAADIKLYVAEIGLAISYLHSIGIVYRDLKPENVLIDRDGHIKLVDFGLSKDILKMKSTSTFCGTPEYMSPEILEKKRYGYKVDEWALGVLLFEMTIGYLPFKDDNRRIMYSRIIEEEPKIPDDTDPNLSDIIRKLLTKDPEKRPKFADLKTHPYFAGLDWSKVFRKEYQPLYIPLISDPLSLDNFDPAVTSEEPNDSFSQPALGDFRNVSGFSFCEQDIK